MSIVVLFMDYDGEETITTADITSPPLRRRSYINLPCPLGSNSSVEFIDAARLTGGFLATIEPWFPFSDVPTGQNNTSKRRRRPSSTHRTCGDGHGLLSAYEFLRSSSANNNQLKSVALLLLMLVRYIM